MEEKKLSTHTHTRHFFVAVITIKLFATSANKHYESNQFSTSFKSFSLKWFFACAKWGVYCWHCMHNALDLIVATTISTPHRFSIIASHKHICMFDNK